MSNKLLFALLGVGLLVASAVTFRAVTGECPLGWCVRQAHGEPAPPPS